MLTQSYRSTVLQTMTAGLLRVKSESYHFNRSFNPDQQSGGNNNEFNFQ